MTGCCGDCRHGANPGASFAGAPLVECRVDPPDPGLRRRGVLGPVDVYPNVNAAARCDRYEPRAGRGQQSGPDLGTISESTR